MVCKMHSGTIDYIMENLSDIFTLLFVVKAFKKIFLMRLLIVIV
jgi:hypothetical protein